MISWRKKKFSGILRSSCTIGATSLSETTWSIPNESRRPNCLTAAVKRLVPAKISTAKTWRDDLPEHLADNLASKVAGEQAVSN